MRSQTINFAGFFAALRSLRLPARALIGMNESSDTGGPVVRSALLFVLGFLFCISAGPALADKRVALVIGMSKYQQVPKLANPARDADAMTSLFKKAGFDVVNNQRDLGISDLRRVIR
jgi:hypothetical protein